MKSHELIGAFLTCPPDGARGPLLLCDECAVSHCLVARQLYRILFSRLSMLPTFQPLSWNSLSILRASHRFDR